MSHDFQIERVTFPSGTGAAAGMCTAYLHHPTGKKAVSPAPVVLMGNGLATEWRFGTADFIRAFTASGLATLNFDYRYFGESSGMPRQWVDFSKQREDWRAALRYLQSREDIDSGRIALWGSSLGGGHALTLAAEHPEIRAVVAQVPHLDSRRAMKNVPLGRLLKTLGHVLYDQLLARFFPGHAPHALPVLAEPGELGLLTQPGWKAHYLRLIPPTSSWRNAVPARSVFTAGNYNPGDCAGQLKMPVLLVYGLRDPGIPVDGVEAVAARMADVECFAFDGDHFDVYEGPLHTSIVLRETDFLLARLGI